MIRELIIAQDHTPPDLWKTLFRVVWTIVSANPLLMLALAALAIIAEALPPTVRRVRRRRAHVGAMGGYFAVEGLLTRTEAEFLPYLVCAVGADKPDGPRVMVKVRLADLVTPAGERGRYQADLNRVWSKHVDFVVVAGPRMVPMRVVELDDPSHEDPTQQGRDAVKDNALRRAAIPLTRVPVNRMTDGVWLRRALEVAH